MNKISFFVQLPGTNVFFSCFQTTQEGIDVQSCVQFLLDLFTEWFRSAGQGLQPLTSGVTTATTARPLLMECLKSLLLISDLFTERQQFEWMFSSVAFLYK